MGAAAAVVSSTTVAVAVVSSTTVAAAAALPTPPLSPPLPPPASLATRPASTPTAPTRTASLTSTPWATTTASPPPATRSSLREVRLRLQVRLRSFRPRHPLRPSPPPHFRLQEDFPPLLSPAVNFMFRCSSNRDCANLMYETSHLCSSRFPIFPSFNQNHLE